MKNKDEKIDSICQVIKTRISDINISYRKGPDLYFYRRVFALRQTSSITEFLSNNYNVEILYATLVSWDMNSRAAKMKYFDEFKKSLHENIDNFKEIDSIYPNGYDNKTELIEKLGNIYDNLSLMNTSCRLVSNSKVLHFLFPKLLMPMDGSNTLEYFYNNTGESKKKYLEIMEICIEIMQRPYDWTMHLDDIWNTTIPKMIDNAVILLHGKSIKNN